MTYASIANVSSLDIGTYLKIFSAKGVWNNLSEASEMWERMLKKRVGKTEGREYRYSIRKAYGAGSAQFLGNSSVGDYPGASRSTLSEATAIYKDFGVTIDVPITLLDKAGSDLAAYGEPLAEELDAKGIVIARMLSASLYGDGSGVIGLVSSVSVVSDRAVITIKTDTASVDRSHIGWFEEEDKLKIVVNTGGTTQRTYDGTLKADYWRVEDIDEENDQVTLSARSSADAELVVDGSHTIAAGDQIIRYGEVANDLTAISTNDYNTLSQVWPGLASLTADDNRKVHGLNMTGAIKGSRKDAGGNPIDSSHFQEALSLTKRRVGKKRYSWKYAYMFDTAYDALVESRETDRRFVTLQDDKRGVSRLGYQHDKDSVMFETDEFCPKKRIYMPPEGDVLQFRGQDFDFVSPNGSDKFHLLPSSSGGHSRAVRAYLEGAGIPTCHHAAAVSVITNFV